MVFYKYLFIRDLCLNKEDRPLKYIYLKLKIIELRLYFFAGCLFMIKNHWYIFVCFILLLFAHQARGQVINTDSLKILVNKTKEDNVQKVNTLNLMAKELLGKSDDKSLIYSWQAFLLSERINYQQGIGNALYLIAVAYYNTNDFVKSLQYHFRAVNSFKTSSNHSGQAQSLQAIGSIYRDLGDYQQALNYLIQAQESHEKIRDKAGIAFVLSEIGTVQTDLRDFVQANLSLEKALGIAAPLKDPSLLGNVHQSLAYYYKKIGNLGEVIKNYQLASKYFQNAKDPKAEARVYNGLGDAYLASNEKNLSLANYLKAIKIQTSIRDSYGLSLSYKGIGALYLQTNTHTRAIEYFEQSLKIAKDFNYKELIRDNYKWIAQSYETTQLTQKALENYKLHKLYTDSIYNQSKLVLIAEMQVRYGLSQQEQEASLQKRRIQALNQQGIEQNIEIINQKRNLRQRNLIIGAFAVIILLAIFLLGLIFESRKRIRQVNQQLNQQNQEIKRQKNELETKSNELVRSYLKITDSIRYAESIQTSLLPDPQTLYEILGEYFVISRPKEIVSGDFYWISKQAYKTFVAVVDCTGHGVSGGFTSIIGQTLLNEIINQNNITEPEKILYWLNQRVKQIIDFKVQEFPIGMEISLITIEEAPEKPDMMEIHFAGAKRPLYYIKANEMPPQVREVRGTRLPIGFFQNQDHQYQQHTLLLEKGSLLYLSTDGYTDQGNKNYKRMGTPQLKKILEENAHQSLAEQKQTLEVKLKAYQGKVAQRDDITLLGLRI